MEGSGMDKETDKWKRGTDDAGAEWQMRGGKEYKSDLKRNYGQLRSWIFPALVFVILLVIMSLVAWLIKLSGCEPQ
jgi:hypothetical protein